LAFLAARAHCWLTVNLLSTRMFLIVCWEICFVKHPEQDIGGVIQNKTDSKQLILLMAAQDFWYSPEAQ